MEASHRALRLRAKGMEALLSQYYDEVLSRELDLSAVNKQEIMGRVLINPARKIILSSSARVFPNKIIERITTSTQVSADDLMKRLNQTEVFGELKEKTETEIRETLESIEDQYNEYSTAMSDYFKRRAKLFSLLAGVLLAFAANIDGVRIYEALKINPEVRANIISQQASLEASYHSAQKNLDKIAAEADKPTEDTKKQIADLKNSLDEATGRIADIASLGLPIGWHYFPASVGNQAISDPFSYLVWVFKVLITGLLIGLGAPFWFEVAQKLTRIKQGPRGKPSPDADEGASPKTHEKTTIDKIIENVGQ